jgi:hypothetical protein
MSIWGIHLSGRIIPNILGVIHMVGKDSEMEKSVARKGNETIPLPNTKFFMCFF